MSSHREHFMSTGIGSLDDVFGGGIPLGSLFLLKSDRRTGYSNLLLRYMTAQGLESQQTVLIIGTKRSISDILEQVPMAVKIEDAIDDGEDSVPSLEMRSGRVMGAVRNDEKMKIAWRYQSLPQISQSSLRPSMTNASVPFLSMFDITKPRSVEPFLKNGQLQVICYSEQEEETNLNDLIAQLPEKLERLKNLNDTIPVRIILPDFGSLVWKDTSGKELFRILFQLKILVNRYPACCTLQLPAYLYNDQTYVSVNPDIRRLEHLADAVLELESFSGTKRTLHPAYTQSTPSQPPYHGLLHVIKLFAIKTLLPTSRRQFSPSQLDSLAFRVRRKRLTIEPFHLPPEEDTNNESMNHLSLNEPISSGCGSGQKSSKLDF